MQTTQTTPKRQRERTRQHTHSELPRYRTGHTRGRAGEDGTVRHPAQGPAARGVCVGNSWLFSLPWRAGRVGGDTELTAHTKHEAPGRARGQLWRGRARGGNTRVKRSPVRERRHVLFLSASWHTSTVVTSSASTEIRERESEVHTNHRMLAPPPHPVATLYIVLSRDTKQKGHTHTPYRILGS